MNNDIDIYKGVNLLQVKINDIDIEVESGISILEACRKLNINIPTFCNDERLIAHGACRICVVEVKNARNLVSACSTPVANGMEIKTHTDNLIKVRKDILELMWGAHDNNCLVCSQAGNCKLQDYCYEYGVEPETTIYKKRLSNIVDSSNKFYTFNRDKCILCGKCVRTCHELQGTGAIGFSERGHYTHVTHPFEAGMEYSACVSCGNCVNVCPTGALLEKKHTKYRNWDIEKKVMTTCAYCGVGCQLELQVMNNEVVNIEPVYDSINQGLLCVKGKFAYNFINHPDRLKTPLIKKNGVFEECSWDEAFDLIVSKMKEVKAAHGSDAFAALSSARCTTEENYVLQKLFRGVLGTNSVDHCARL